MHEPVATLNRKLNYLLAETDAAYHDLALKLGLADSTMMILYALTDAQGRCPLQSLYRGTGPILTAIRVTPAEPAKNEVATF